MTDLHTALARLEEAGIETPTAVAKWETWFHGEAPFAGHSVVSDTPTLQFSRSPTSHANFWRDCRLPTFKNARMRIPGPYAP